MESRKEHDDEKFSPMSSAIGLLNAEKIFDKGNWIRHILNLLREHPKPEDVAIALIIFNRYFSGGLVKASKQDHHIKALFHHLSATSVVSRPLDEILNFIILFEYGLCSKTSFKSIPTSVSLSFSSSSSSSSSASLSASMPLSSFNLSTLSNLPGMKNELLGALYWLKAQLSLESDAEQVYSKFILKELILSMKRYPHPILLVASYVLLMNLPQPSWKLLPYTAKQSLKLDTIYYCDFDGKLGFIFPKSDQDGVKFTTELDYKTESAKSGFPLNLMAYLKQQSKLAHTYYFDKTNILKMLLKVKLPFTFSMLLERCLSLAFWIDPKYHNLMIKVLSFVDHWSQDSELVYYLLSRVSKNQMTPEFFEKLIQLSNTKTQTTSESTSSSTSATTTAVSASAPASLSTMIKPTKLTACCSWIKDEILFNTTNSSGILIEEEKSSNASAISFNRYWVYLLQDQRFSVLFSTVSKSLPGFFRYDKIKKEEFYEAPVP